MRMRLFSWMLLSSLMFVFSGCTPPVSEPDAGVIVDPDACRRNIECGGGSVCLKEPDEDYGQCAKVDCFSPQDSRYCGEGCACNANRGICECAPDCWPAYGEPCGDDAACVMSGGDALCSPLEELPTAVACVAWPAVAHVRSGGTTSVGLLAANAEHHPVPYGACSLSVTTDDVNCEQAPCLAPAVTSSCGRSACSVERRIYASLLANEARVVVVEEGSGAPLGGVRVVVRSGGELLEATTGGDGVARFDEVGVVEHVSVLPSEHEWHTLVGDARDVLVVTKRVVPDDVIAAARATFDFSDVTTQGDVKVVGGGVSLDELSRLSVEALFGGLETATVQLEGVTDVDGEEVDMHWGAVLELAADKFKGEALLVGREGRRIPWGLGGRIRLSQLGDVITASAELDRLFGPDSLIEMMTVYGKADHVLGPVVELQAHPRPVEVSAGFYEAVSSAELPYLRLDTLTTVPLAISAPRLPCPPSSPECGEGGTENALIFSALADVPGRGSVPLGLLVGRDDPTPHDDTDLRDGVVDTLLLGEPRPPGLAVLNIAPPHDGLEGTELVLAAFSHGPTIAGVPSVTALVSRMMTIPAEASFGRELLPYPRALVAEQTVTLDDVDADLTRLELRGDDVLWNVWLPDDAVTVDLASLLPADVVIPAGTIAVTALVLEADDVTPASLFDLGRGGASSLQRDLRAWSTVGCGEGSSCVVE